MRSTGAMSSGVGGSRYERRGTLRGRGALHDLRLRDHFSQVTDTYRRKGSFIQEKTKGIFEGGNTREQASTRVQGNKNNQGARIIVETEALDENKSM